MPQKISALYPVGALAVFAVAVAGLWMWAVPDVVSRSSGAVIVALILGAAGVTLSAWRDAQATGTVGQLLQATEAGDDRALDRAGTQPRSR